jgi:hypothetical protein
VQATLFIRMQLFHERIIEGAFFTLGEVVTFHSATHSEDFPRSRGLA